jgi:hypothetical protein
MSGFDVSRFLMNAQCVILTARSNMPLVRHAAKGTELSRVSLASIKGRVRLRRTHAFPPSRFPRPTMKTPLKPDRVRVRQSHPPGFERSLRGPLAVRNAKTRFPARGKRECPSDRALASKKRRVRHHHDLGTSTTDPTLTPPPLKRHKCHAPSFWRMLQRVRSSGKSGRRGAPSLPPARSFRFGWRLGR